jgi:hypothetical protein
LVLRSIELAEYDLVHRHVFRRRSGLPILLVKSDGGGLALATPVLYI